MCCWCLLLNVVAVLFLWFAPFVVDCLLLIVMVICGVVDLSFVDWRCCLLGGCCRFVVVFYVLGLLFVGCCCSRVLLSLLVVVRCCLTFAFLLFFVWRALCVCVVVD